jgi:hypothetical protein
MSLRYACFISYRQSVGVTLSELIEQFLTALGGELDPLVGAGRIFRDKEELKPGVFFEEKIAKAIHQSVCMIMVYTPTYFDKHHTYCAREFKTMEKIESERLKLLPKSHNDNGLIIPVIFRGSIYFPQEIKIKRQCFNFEDPSLYHRRMNRHPYYAPKIREIADYIADRCAMCAKVKGRLFKKGNKYKLATEDEVKPWVDEYTKNQPWTWP